MDCGENIKIEDIKGEINEEESVDDPLTIQQEIESSNVYKDIKEEVKEEESVDDPLFIQEGKEIGENDNICKEVKEEEIDNDEIDIVEHKI